MEIERINENTVKFYISYIDIEDRGFDKEDIWYNRERSEQLFWQMMEEVNYKEDFSVEGPLWIQVHALDKGLEIIVTKAQISQGEGSGDSIDNIEEIVDFPLNDKSKGNFDINYDDVTEDDIAFRPGDENLWLVAMFKNFEDVIQLSHYFQDDFENDIMTSLYHYKDKYYLYVEITADLFDYQEDISSRILEYGEEAEITDHMLEEYGKVIIGEQVFAEVRSYFEV